VVVLVKVKKSSPRNIEKAVSELLRPYDEQLKVPEHEERCSCIGFSAYRRTYEKMRKKFGTTETREAQEFGKETFETDPDASLPQATCELCNGTGKWGTTLNPNGKWDWWSFGGRWDRAIQGDPSRTNAFSISHTHELDGNTTTPQFLIDCNITPAAIVTPDGVWHEEERWKSWEWDDTSKSILSKNLETLAVGIDCHG